MTKFIACLAGLAGIAVLIGFEIAGSYYILPFPGSQQQDTAELAYFLINSRIYFRLLGFALLVFPVYYFFTRGNTTYRVLLIAFAFLYLVVYYQINYRLQADTMFVPMKQTAFVTTDKSTVNPAQLVLAIAVNGEARAYPVEILGYHQQVRDTVGGEQVMVTYCTVSRTGRVYRPDVNNVPDNFRLVGMNQYNTLFEDNQTKSWWRQVNGEAVAGYLKGKTLAEVPSYQMSLQAWVAQYPNTRILQPDTFFTAQYKILEQFDEGLMESTLEKRDTLPWQDKSWIVGVQLGNQSVAYDWNTLVETRIIQDKLNGINLFTTLNSDGASFGTWNRDTLEFVVDEGVLKDKQTASVWNWQGQCVSGKLSGARLNPVQSYQQFWHSWRTFCPGTKQYPAP